MAKSDLFKRTVFGILFGAVVIVSLVFLPSILPYMMLLTIYMELREFYNISIGREYPVQQAFAVGTAAVLFATAFLTEAYGTDSRYVLFSLIPFFALLISIIFRKDRSDLEKYAFIFTGLVYVSLPAYLLPKLLFRSGIYDGMLALSVIIVIWFSDIFAYALGTAFGQKENSRKLAPTISPKKSWIGFWSGVISGGIAAIILYYIGWLQLPFAHCVSLGLIISAAGVCGDLFESVWKRYFGVKDSGNIIPGHGGFLDRFDSSIFAIPAVVVYLALFNLL